MKFLLSRRQNYWLRQHVMLSICIVFFIIFILRIIIINNTIINNTIVKNINIKEKAQNQSTYYFYEKSYRGNIVDKNNNILASDLLLKEVNIDPTLIQDEYIDKLAKTLEENAQQLRSKIITKRAKNSKYLIAKKNLKLNSTIIKNIELLKKERIQICRIKAITKKTNKLNKILIYLKLQKVAQTDKKLICKKERIYGVALQPYSSRYYPQSASLAPLIGRLNIEKKGISGIEDEFNHILAGQDGKKKLIFDQVNKIYFNPIVITKLRHGENIQLTIDTDIQFYAYEAIKKSVKKHEANAGSAIVINNEGEVLAMVNYPAENPNNKQIYNPKNYRNRVLTDKFEPGSAMKPFIALLALNNNKISASENEFIDVSKQIGHIKPDGKYQQMTVKKILQKSHNLGIVNIAERLSKQDIYDSWKKLGFESPLGLIPNIENSGSLKHFFLWSKADKHTISFGYGPMNTNLAQLAKAYLVFANKGRVLPLKLIKNSNTSHGYIQVFKEEPTAKIAELLKAVVSNNGSGYRAKIKGYSVAGKTSTTEKIIAGKYSKKGAKRTFFVGFVPHNKPKYIMAIQLDHPKKCFANWDSSIKEECEGSNSAAMVFKDAMTNILNNDTSIKLLTQK